MDPPANSVVTDDGTTKGHVTEPGKTNGIKKSSCDLKMTDLTTMEPGYKLTVVAVLTDKDGTKILDGKTIEIPNSAHA